MIYDLIIVGGGPGGAAAGVYAARKRIKSLLITKDWGGQSNVSVEIQNWIGVVSMSGHEMMKKIEEHVKAYADNILAFDEGSLVAKISQKNPIFDLETDKGKKYQAKSIIVVSGSRRRKLDAPGSKEFEGKGVVYCASCDAPLFKDKEVAVVGGGNAGFESAQQLLAYAAKIYILEYGEDFKADEVTRENVMKDKRVVPITMAEITEIKGNKLVNALSYKNRKTGENKELSVQGVFVEIGSIPNSDFVKGLVELNKHGEIAIDHKTCRTSVEGIWAAGDVTDSPYKQNNISMGDAVKALEDLYVWLQKNK
ncbi:MAG: FAD-dependent oxidoreductase [Candidatus Nealsonbacteria bacterium]|nr:FAD-dependent oxidoreductase [Candidatus Nealsonbacteria bacterium]